MDDKWKEFCATGLALIIVAGSFPPAHRESEKAIVHEDHTHQDPYQYEHIKSINSMTLSSTMALNNLYGELSEKVKYLVEFQKYIDSLKEK
jgi:hypothetical protein